jgi:hypothetical protein
MLGWQACVVAEGLPFKGVVEDAAYLEDGYDVVDEVADFGAEIVEVQHEAVRVISFEPFP